MPVASNVFSRVWRFVDRFSARESVDRADLDAAFEDVASGINAALTITDGAVTSAKISNAAVTVTKIADASVATVKIADGAVTGAKIATKAVSAGLLADNAVITAKITDLAVTSGKIANLAVTEAKLATSAVTATKIADGAVTAAKLASGVIPALTDQQSTTLDSETQGIVSGRQLYDAHKEYSVISTFTERTFSITQGGTLSSGSSGPTFTPRFSLSFLVCQTAEHGYSVNDEIQINPCLQGGAAGAYGHLVFMNSGNNPSVQYGNASGVFQLLHKTTGALVTITPANWRLKVKIYGY